ncbi:lycopene cyclase family protein [Lewinella sp. IMCC34183]|uniref:lycopene cyclase family protein n=1 Tax=Lewinella sp. IMCC34183 TaxID=2248762 RepID=UPI000E27C545|nr:lycopene cyclase family protein [Lewinella sp. IMCC34183]
MKTYDVAVLGGGLAGLSILYHLQTAGKLAGKQVLLVDPERKSGHDRTWSFWERGEGPFEEIVYKHWNQVTLHNTNDHCTCDLAPYTYKLIRSTEFYAYANGVVDGINGLTRLPGLATDVKTDGKEVTFRVAGKAYRSGVAYSSLPHPLDHREVKQPYLDQHFRGWYVETEEDVFDPERATLMDFRTPQLGETRFFYVLPFTARRAVVEIAIFSNDHLRTEQYDDLLTTYIREHWTGGGYRIEQTEAGNIPMTTYPFPQRQGNLIYIGLGGGAARPSTGYTFYGLQRQLAAMAARFPQIGLEPVWPNRHLLYDATLLRILEKNSLPGDQVFVNLFRKNPADRVLAFLNGESSLWQELALMSTVPTVTFAATFTGEVLR